MAYLLKKLNSFKTFPKHIFNDIICKCKLIEASVNFNLQIFPTYLIYEPVCIYKSSLNSKQFNSVSTESNGSYIFNKEYKHKRKRGKNFHLSHFFLMSIAFPFLSSTDKDETEDHVTLTIKKSIVAMQNGEFDKAEQLLHVVLKSAQDLKNEDAITFIFDIMANLALQREQFQKAHDIFVEVLKRILRGGMATNDNSVIEISLKLATIFANLDEQEKAKQGFLFCIHTQDEKLKHGDLKDVDEDTIALWAMSHDWYGRYLLSFGQFSNAKDHFLTALDVCVKLKGESDTHTAVLLNDLGTISSLQQNYDEALDYFSRAIDIGEKKEATDLASFYVNIANVYLFKNMVEKAYYFCKKGLKLARELGNDESIREAKECLEMIKKNELLD